MLIVGCDGAAAGLGLDPDRCAREAREVEQALADLQAALADYEACERDCEASRELWFATTVDHALTYADWSDCTEQPL